MRPPRPYPETEVSAGLHVVDGKLEVFEPSFQALVDLQKQLSLEELEQSPPGGEGDFASTLFGLSAVIAHVLGVYQDFFGGEAFLATARTEQSLVRHGRRVGYTSDPGVAATGVVAINVKEGLSGKLPRGLPLLSVPKGEQGTEHYETLDERTVDSRWNAMEPLETTLPVDRIAEKATSLEVVGVGLDLTPGDTVLIVRLAANGAQRADVKPLVRKLVAVAELAALGTTRLDLDQAISDGAPLAEWRVFSKPALELRLFGWDADPRVFPPAVFATAGTFEHQPKATTGGDPTSEGDVTVITYPPNFGYEAFDEAGEGPDSDPDDLYLAQPLATPVAGTWILRAPGDAAASPEPYFVETQRTVSVSFVREEQQDTSVSITGQEARSDSTNFVKTWISASTTAIDLRTASAQSPRSQHDVRTRWLGAFELELELKAEVPNLDAVPEGAPLPLKGDLSGLEPGMLAVLTTRDSSTAQLIELTHVELAEQAVDVASTTIVWKRRGAVASAEFKMNDVLVLGNAVRVSHGKSVNEVLGDSDGVTPFLRFALKKSPVTQLPDALGAIPELEVRVNDVLWTRVTDFSESGPEDRHYVVQRDEAQVTQILFGDGRKGAIPPAGRRHVRANYRQGLGRIGNVEAGRLSRLEKAHPLVANVRNPVPVAAGTEPASLSQIRLESTKFIRTFDRAVSAPDHADLALLFPGVARASATSSPSSGVQLVVSDADGLPLADAAAFRAFLDSRRDKSTPLTLRGPSPVDLSVSVRVEYDPAFFDFQIERALRDVLSGLDEAAPGLFTFRGRAIGEPGFLSQAYRAVNSAPGVVFSEILAFDLAPDDAQHQPELRDAVRVAPHEWLRLEPRNLRIETRKQEV